MRTRASDMDITAGSDEEFEPNNKAHSIEVSKSGELNNGT